MSEVLESQDSQPWLAAWWDVRENKPAVLHSTIEGVLSVGGEQYENSLEKKEYWKSMWEKAAVYNGIAQWT